MSDTNAPLDALERTERPSREQLWKVVDAALRAGGDAPIEMLSSRVADAVFDAISDPSTTAGEDLSADESPDDGTSWHYQALRTTDQHGNVAIEMFEAYDYGEGGTGYTAEPSAPEGETPDELENDLVNMLADFRRFGVIDLPNDPEPDESESTETAPHEDSLAGLRGTVSATPGGAFAILGEDAIEEWGLRYLNLQGMPVYISAQDEDPEASARAAMSDGDVLVRRLVTPWRPSAQASPPPVPQETGTDEPESSRA